MKRSIVAVTAAMVHYFLRPPPSISPAQSGGGGSQLGCFETIPEDRLALEPGQETRTTSAYVCGATVRNALTVMVACPAPRFGAMICSTLLLRSKPAAP